MWWPRNVCVWPGFSFVVNHETIAPIAGPILARLEPTTDANPEIPEAEEEAALLAQGASGDQAAWQQLFDKWKKPLLAFFYRSLGSMAESEDLTLEVFVRLHRAADRYEPRAHFATFIFHIARNLLLNELRRRRRKPAQPLPPEAFDYFASSDSEECRRATELEEIFQQGLARLPESQRTLLLLMQQQGFCQSDAARMLGITENSLRVQLHRARQHLKEIMSSLP